MVVGVDGSSGGRNALAWAVTEAVHRHATLEIVHSWTSPVSISSMGGMAVYPGDDAFYQEAAEQLVAGLVEEIRAEAEAAGVAIESQALQGHATTLLLDRLERADLLVVGSRGHSNLVGLLVGSVSHQCVHHATKPVVVVPAESPPSSDGQIVVGVDGSEESWAALRWAVTEAGIRSAPLRVVHGWWTPVAVPPVGIALGDSDFERFEQETEQMLHEMVNGMLEQADPKPASIQLEAVPQAATEALVDRSNGSALLVVGSRGRGGFKGLLLGSVSQQVLHHAECPVAVIR